MRNNPFRPEDELKELLSKYSNLRLGKSHSYIDEEGFEAIINYYEDIDKYNLALEAVNLALEMYPSSASLLVKKGGVLISLKKYHDAINYLDMASIFDSSDTNIFILKTEAYLALDEQAKAAALLEDALQFFEGAEKIELLFELTDVYDDYEEFDKLFNCLKLIIELDPENEEALFKMCFWADFSGRYEESIELYKKAIDQSPYNKLLWFNLGSVFQSMKLFEKAIDAYLYATAIDDKFEFAYHNLGYAYMQSKKYKLAIEALEKAMELFVPEADVYVSIGDCYNKLNNFAQARFYFKKASHLDPELGSFHYYIAITYMNEYNWQMAVKSLTLATKLDGMKADYEIALGRCFFHLDDIAEAINHFANVVKLKPKVQSGWIELLKTLFYAELHEQGSEYSSIAYIETNAKPIFIFFKAMFLIESSKIKEGLEVLETGLMKNPQLVKKIIDIDPRLFHLPKVAELISRYKKKRS